MTQFIKSIRILSLMGALMVALFIAPIVSHAQNATVANASRLNFRSGPGVQYSVLAEVGAGTPLTLVGRNSDGTWVQGTLYTGLIGWVNSQYVSTGINIFNLPVTFTTTPPTYPTPTPIPMIGNAYVNTPMLNLRTGPGANFSIVQKMPYGTQLTLTGRNADAKWVQVTVVGGASGWVSFRYLASSVYVYNLPVASNTGVTPGYTPPVTLEGQSGVVANATYLNVRLGPSVWYPPFTTVASGTPLRMLKRNADGSWVLIQLANGTTGWVNSNYIYTTYPVLSLPIAS